MAVDILQKLYSLQLDRQRATQSVEKRLNEPGKRIAKKAKSETKDTERAYKFDVAYVINMAMFMNF